MAVNADIVYNFNENDPTNIKDYSDGGSNDGTSSTITIAATDRNVGFDAVFDAITEQIDMGNITALNGSSNAGIHLSIRIDATIGELGTVLILTKAGLLQMGYNHGAGLFAVTLTDATATTATLTTAATLGVWYDFDVVYTSDLVTLYKDGVSVATDGTLSGPLATNANTMYFGYNGVTNSTEFLLNEFKLYSGIVTTDIIDAFIAEQNGILSTNFRSSGFAVGDIIVSQLDLTPLYAIITYVDADFSFRFLPISDGITGGMRFQRVGNLFDTTRQQSLHQDSTPEICFYEGVSATIEAFTVAKQITCLNKNGIFENGKTISTTYTVLDNDRFFDVDLSSAAFTALLPATVVPNKLYTFKDTGDANGVRRLTIDGNGNNVDGVASFIAINSSYEALTVKGSDDGTQWLIVY